MVLFFAAADLTRQAGIVVTIVNEPFQVRPADLVGCRYRLRQRLAHPEVGPTPAGQSRQAQLAAARALVFAALPVKRAVGDGRGKAFVRVDLATADTSEELALRDGETREALRRGAHLITRAVLCGEIDGVRVVCEIDVLVRTDAGYMPVIVSNHRVARKDPASLALMVPTGRLGLGAPLEVQAKPRHHTIDGYTLAMAHLLLGEKASGRGGVIGQDRERAYVGELARFIPPLKRALDTPIPPEPRRLKQCATCRFWPLCGEKLEEMDDISLVFSGGRGDQWRERGIHTVGQLIDANVGDASRIAQAWREGVPVLRRRGPVHVPRAEVAIDVDMEAYLDQGAYLWGAFDGEVYHPFVIWEEVGGEAEERNFTEFWRWLMARRDAAHAEGKTFAAYCYAAGGENHWLKSSAKRFDTVALAEVQAFIASDEWVDVFAHVRQHLVGTDGLGLKVLGPVVGFTWEDDDVDGEASVALRRQARRDDEAGAEARATLLQYNEDDCRATRAVREFLDAGAPGLPLL